MDIKRAAGFTLVVAGGCFALRQFSLVGEGMELSVENIFAMLSLPAILIIPGLWLLALTQPIGRPNIEKLKEKDNVKGLIQALTYSDKDVRKSAANALDSLGWKPENDIQRGAYAVARENWAEAVRLGAVAKVRFVITSGDTEHRYSQSAIDIIPSQIVTSAEDADYVVQIKENKYTVGKYSYGGLGVRIDFAVAVFQHASSKLVSSRSFPGGNPGDTLYELPEVLGKIPVDATKTYLRSLLDDFFIKRSN